MRKLLAIGIIFLFLGVAVAPSINSSVVKTSDDLVEVTSQACGIQGFGNTTVKLTKQQYQDLQNYLVDFRARLNQTTTRKEVIPIFKDAVVELNKYGLLPKGMSVERAQKLVLGGYQNPRYLQLLDKMQNSFRKNYSDYENYLCLIQGSTSLTTSQGPLVTAFRFASINKYILFSDLTEYFIKHNRPFLAYIFGKITNLFIYERFLISALGLGSTIYNLINPIPLLSVIGFGFLFIGPYGSEAFPAHGTIFTNGLNGIKDWTGDFYGAIMNTKYLLCFSQLVFFEFYPGILGFSGIKINLPQTDGLESSYFGTALGIKISLNPPYLN